MIRHVVMWELHDPAQAPVFRDALLPCAKLVAGMRGYEVAIKSDTLPASVHVCLIASFDDADALQRYQDHPLHQQVVRRIGPLRKLRHILDYEVAAEPRAAAAAPELSLVV
jgi:quinol monooxygenase YgiN